MISPAAWLRGPGKKHQVEWLALAILIAAALWYWLRYFDRSTNLLDEGSTAAQALRILNGDLIYRDFFTVVTPLSYYTVALLLKIFGLHLLVLRWAALATGIGILLATWCVTRRLAAWPFAWCAAAMTTVWGWFLVTPNFYSLQASLFVMIALASYLRGSIVTAGIFVGLAAMTKQNVGAYAAIALVLTIWLSAIFEPTDARARWRTTLRFIGGMAIPVVPILLALVIAGAGAYLYESWVYYPLVKYPGRFALAYPKFAPLLKALPQALAGRIPEPANYDFWTGMVLQLPLLTYPLALIALLRGAWHRREVPGTPVTSQAPRQGAWHHAHASLAVTLMAAFTLLQAWPRADATHILFGMPPTYALLAHLLSLLVRSWHENPERRLGRYIGGERLGRYVGSERLGRYILTAVALVPVVALLWIGYKRTQWEYQNYIAGLHVEGARGISTQYLEAQRIDTVTKYIVEHTHPDDHIFVVPWAAGFYFLTDRENPTRTDFMLFEDPEAYPCLIARLDQKPPKYVIYGYTWDVDDKRFRDYAAPVDQYIRAHYKIEFTTDGYEIWRRTSDRPAATPFTNACRPRSFHWRDFEKR